MVGDVPVGGGAPVSVQSMTNTRTDDSEATLKQIFELAAAGCRIVRVAVPDEDAVGALPELKTHSPIPIIADIHFHHGLALAAIEAGCDGLRINPGNIGGKDRVRQVTRAAGEAGIPIRIGVNSGSVPKELLAKHGSATAEALVEAGLAMAADLESMNFGDIKLSFKASDIGRTVAAYRLAAERCDYPFHVGITEAGLGTAAVVRSSVGIGILLAEGIGDTIRVSLTGPPVEEVRVGLEILRGLGLAPEAVRVIACPTCGRTQLELEPLAQQVEERLASFPGPLTVAVMGCVVNGPGEAREADYGITAGDGEGLIFRRGEVIARLPEKELVDRLIGTVEQDRGSPPSSPPEEELTDPVRESPDTPKHF
jgi:(E)-4-hydroxy-3-methylbut-2-enyl-diphosphate synthase